MIYDRYYYSRLSNVEKAAYRSVYHGLERYDGSIEITDPHIDIYKILDAVNFDNPHLFFVNFNKCKVTESSLTMEYVPSYHFSREQTARLWQSVNNSIKKILPLVSCGSEYENQLSVHDLFVKNISYDDRAKTDVKLCAYSSTVLGVFLRKRALCEGIAKAVKLLLNAMDIKCIVAIGGMHSDNSVNHAWNIIKLNNIASHMDITNDLDLNMPGVVHHTYCNLTDNQLAKTHSKLYNYPHCQYSGYDYFVKNSLCVSDNADLRRIIFRACSCGARYAEFRMNSHGFDENTVMRTVMQILLEYMRARSINLTSCINREQGVLFVQW